MKLTQLLNCLRRSSPDVSKMGSQFWLTSKDGYYSVKRYYSVALENTIDKGLSNPSSIREERAHFELGVFFVKIRWENHLLLHCQFSWKIWSFFLHIFGVFT